jgi:hypothetical protein
MLAAPILLATPLQSGVSCVAADGDTLRCGRERVRLLGIDAPGAPRPLPAGQALRAGRSARLEPGASRRLVARADYDPAPWHRSLRPHAGAGPRGGPT